jgi:hypothetical protein
MKKTLTRFAVSTIALHRRPYFWILNLLSLLAIAGAFGWIYWRLFPEILSQPGVPLHYNIHSGVDSFGRWQMIFLAPSIALGLFILNNWLAILLAYGVDVSKDRKWLFYLPTLASALFLIHAVLQDVFGIDVIMWDLVTNRWYDIVIGFAALIMSASGIVLVNDAIASLFGTKDQVLSYIMIAVSALASILTLVAVFYIVQLNINFYG